MLCSAVQLHERIRLDPFRFRGKSSDRAILVISGTVTDPERLDVVPTAHGELLLNRMAILHIPSNPVIDLMTDEATWADSDSFHHYAAIVALSEILVRVSQDEAGGTMNAASIDSNADLFSPANSVSNTRFRYCSKCSMKRLKPATSLKTLSRSTIRRRRWHW
jgi:hypothetical protein